MNLVKKHLKAILIDKDVVLRACVMILLYSIVFNGYASNSKRYYATHFWDIVEVSQDTVVFYGSVFTWVPDEVSDQMVNAVCRLTHEKENFYKIQNFENPEDKALKNISVTGCNSDTISPGRRVIVFKDLYDCEYINWGMSYKINDKTVVGRNKEIKNGDCIFTCEVKEDYTDENTQCHVYFTAEPDNYSWFSTRNRYFGPVEITSGIRSPLSVPNCNYVEIRIPNLSDKTFQEYWIKGDYVYIDSKKFIWNGIEYERIKPNDRRIKVINAKMGWTLGK